MINEERTFADFGYVSGDLSRGSSGKIWITCIVCGEDRIVSKSAFDYHISKGKGTCRKCGFINRGPFNIKYFYAVQDSILNCYVDELRTFSEYGYYSIDLSIGSSKRIYGLCETCGTIRNISYKNYYKYNNKCVKCATLSKPPATGDTKRKISNAVSGRVLSAETKSKIGQSKVGIHRSYDTRMKLSAFNQSIEISEWQGFSNISQYCSKFNDMIREDTRKKYNHKCFICNKHEHENIPKTSDKYRKLSVHHIDKNKMQGCDDAEWALIPVCMQCHMKVHNPKMESYITYIIELEKSKEGYKY